MITKMWADGEYIGAVTEEEGKRFLWVIAPWRIVRCKEPKTGGGVVTEAIPRLRYIVQETIKDSGHGFTKAAEDITIEMRRGKTPGELGHNLHPSSVERWLHAGELPSLDHAKAFAAAMEKLYPDKNAEQQLKDWWEDKNKW